MKEKFDYDIESGEIGNPFPKEAGYSSLKYFIGMIGDRNKPVGDWIDQDLMADGTRVGDE